jgi:IS30 family transposase
MERDRIAQLIHQGANQKEIAAAIQRSPATVSRELRRNRDGAEYHACQAQGQSEARRRERPLTRKLERPEIHAAVRRGLSQGWAPEQIAGRLKCLHEDHPQWEVTAPTIYAWIEQSEDSAHWKSFLRRRGKRPCRRKNTAISDDGARIANRPEVIEARLRLGDWEGDTVLGPPGTGGLVTLVDRKSRYTIITKINSKEAEHVHARIKLRLRELAEELRRSITFDNGSEFARCDRLEQHLGLELYFADPGCPYQRGTNENTNGLIRQYFPKGTDFREITHHAVRNVENLLNNRPRECLGFRTPSEVFFEQ